MTRLCFFVADHTHGYGRCHLQALGVTVKPWPHPFYDERPVIQLQNQEKKARTVVAIDGTGR